MKISISDNVNKGDWINVKTFGGKSYVVRYRDLRNAKLATFVQFANAICKLADLSKTDDGYDKLQTRLAEYKVGNDYFGDFDLAAELSHHTLYVEEYIDIVGWLEQNGGEQPELKEAA